MRTPTWCQSWMGSASCPAPPTSSCTRSQVRCPLGEAPPALLGAGTGTGSPLGPQSCTGSSTGTAPGDTCSVFFLSPPAEASQEIFKIASMAPGALLLEAQKEYEVRHPALLHTCLLPSLVVLWSQGSPWLVGGPWPADPPHGLCFPAEGEPEGRRVPAGDQGPEAAPGGGEPVHRGGRLRARAGDSEIPAAGEWRRQRRLWVRPKAFPRLLQASPVSRSHTSPAGSLLWEVLHRQVPPGELRAHVPGPAGAQRHPGLPDRHPPHLHPVSCLVGRRQGVPGGQGVWSELGSVSVPRAGCPSVMGSRAARLALGCCQEGTGTQQALPALWGGPKFP